MVAREQQRHRGFQHHLSPCPRAEGQPIARQTNRGPVDAGQGDTPIPNFESPCKLRTIDRHGEVAPFARRDDEAVQSGSDRLAYSVRPGGRRVPTSVQPAPRAGGSATVPEKRVIATGEPSKTIRFGCHTRSLIEDQTIEAHAQSVSAVTGQTEAQIFRVSESGGGRTDERGKSAVGHLPNFKVQVGKAKVAPQISRHIKGAAGKPVERDRKIHRLTEGAAEEVIVAATHGDGPEIPAPLENTSPCPTGNIPCAQEISQASALQFQRPRTRRGIERLRGTLRPVGTGLLAVIPAEGRLGSGHEHRLHHPRIRGIAQALQIEQRIAVGRILEHGSTTGHHRRGETCAGHVDEIQIGRRRFLGQVRQSRVEPALVAEVSREEKIHPRGGQVHRRPGIGCCDSRDRIREVRQPS